MRRQLNDIEAATPLIDICQMLASDYFTRALAGCETAF